MRGFFIRYIMTIKKQSLKSGEFFICSSLFVEDVNISIGAKCVLMYLYSRADWWKVRKCHIQEVLGIKNITTLNKYIKELEQANYLQIVDDVWKVLTPKTTPQEKTKPEPKPEPKKEYWYNKAPREYLYSIMVILKAYHIAFNDVSDDRLQYICENQHLSDKTLKGIMQFIDEYPETTHAWELMQGLAADDVFWNNPERVSDVLATIFSFDKHTPRDRYMSALSKFDSDDKAIENEYKQPPHLRDVNVLTGDPDRKAKLWAQAKEYATTIKLNKKEVEEWAKVNHSYPDRLSYPDKENSYRENLATRHFQTLIEEIQNR